MVAPEIGLSTLYSLGQPFKESIQNILKNNVKFIEVVDEGLHQLDKRRVSKLIEIGKSYSLKYSVHAPFVDINIASPSKTLLKAMFKRLLNSLTNARALEAQVWVVHSGLKTGISMFYPEEDWVKNLETMQLLCKTARDYGINLALENLPDPYPFLMKRVEDFQKFYGEISEEVGLALDIGHANLNGQIEFFIEKFPDKIVHIHAHDNNGMEDQHLGIGFGTVNWSKTVKALKEVAYSKTVVVESVEHVSESLKTLERLLV